ncbi:MAG: STAS domain-containing protein [Pirellulaceae bacterium]|nr:STAS domain-containing protein [Pirellulaceae bacterium]
MSNRGDYVVAELHGPIDESLKPALDESLHPLVSDGPAKIILDLSDCQRISSAGIGHLVTLVSRANTKGGRVVMVQLTPFVKAIFEATRLDRFFDIKESVEAGAAAVG